MDEEFRKMIINEFESLLDSMSGKLLDLNCEKDDTGIVVLFVSLLRKYHLKNDDILLFLNELGEGLDALGLVKKT